MITSRKTVLATALLAAVGGAFWPATAQAEPVDFVGRYLEQEADGTYTWDFTPCGPGCSTTTSPDDHTVQNLQWRLDGARWSSSGPTFFTCDGIDVPATINYQFDAVTLAGDWTAIVHQDGCGTPAGGSSPVTTFQLVPA